MNAAATLALIVFSGGFAFFAIRWIQLRSGYRAMSTVEQTYATVTADSAKAEAKRRSPIRRLKTKMVSLGLGESIFPLIAASAFAYLAAVAALRLTRLTDLWTLLLAGPAAVIVIWIVRQIGQKRNSSRFNQQMITMLELLTAQVKAGNGVDRALTTITPSLPQPMRGEMEICLNAAATGGDLLVSLSELRDRYPSRAFDMFLAAIEIDKSEGHTITPALIQASDLLKKTFALQSEARAELSSTRWEFIGVTAILLGISAKMLFAGNASTDAVFTSPIGITILVLCGANTALGIWRFNRLTNKIRKDTE